MVRAGVVRHPGEWKESGYEEIQNPPRRYGMVNVPVLMNLLGLDELKKLQEARAEWIESQRGKVNQRDAMWTEAVGTGSQEFVEEVKEKLGMGLFTRCNCQGQYWYVQPSLRSFHELLRSSG